MNEIADPYENSRIKNTARWILLPYKYFLVLGIGLLIFVRFLDNRSMVRFMVSLFYMGRGHLSVYPFSENMRTNLDQGVILRPLVEVCPMRFKTHVFYSRTEVPDCP